ncbi:MAG: hypothetical protein AB8U25_05530 [Rickettsiales endosymbiont of Dermacentor nuttalli]
MIIDFSNQGKTKSNVGYNRPPGMSNLTVTMHYTANHHYAKIEIGDNIPIEKAKYATIKADFIFN